jgi:hypothetical protein
MSIGKVYKQAIKRVFAEKYHDERMAVYWGREDDTIHGAGFSTLNEGQVVQYEEVSNRGRMAAENLRVSR